MCLIAYSIGTRRIACVPILQYVHLENGSSSTEYNLFRITIFKEELEQGHGYGI